MAKKTDTNKESALNSLDLTQLSDLSFGPDWASETGKKKAESNYRSHDGEDRRSSRPRRRQGGNQGGGQRDRRGESRERRGGNNYNRGDGRRQGDRPYRPPFEPTVDVIFVSQDKPFEVLLKAMRTTFKTYELFEIARIVLGKENRFVAIVSPKKDADERKIFISVPDQLPFQTRDEAINHVLNNHIERFFDITEVEVEPPSGNFQMVNRCKLTGELLAPPNFHRYQDILKEHYQKNISNLSFERFLERVESIKDPEIVQEWIDKMKVTRQYTLKQKEGDESPRVVLSALEDVRYYLTTERKNEVFVAKDKVRLPGEKLELLPRGDLRRSIERELETQRRFPLVTSNHLRGRLRRCNLNFFKKGSKGITYVCAVKRKPRYKDTVFSESIQALIEHIEANPKIVVDELLKTYLPTGATEVNEDTQKAVTQDLRWLVGAGYVSEFGNGQLLAEKALDVLSSEDKNNQQAEAPKGKKAKQKAQEAAVPTTEEAPKKADEPVAVAEEAPVTQEEPSVVEPETEVAAEAETKVEEKAEEPVAVAEEAPVAQEEPSVVEPETEVAAEAETKVEETTEETEPTQELVSEEADPEEAKEEATPEATEEDEQEKSKE